MQQRATLKSLAEILNVSVSTVSKSLANNSEISKETRLKVKALADQYDYTPNQYAVSLRKGKTQTIGVIIPNILNPFFAKVLIGLEDVLSKEGYNIITSISNETASKEIKCVNTMSNNSIDGLIMCLSRETQISKDYNHLNTIIEKGLPIVLFDRINDDLKCDKVIIDDLEASYRATEHLIKNKGCKNIALLSSIDNLHLGQLRLQGYKNALLDNNIKINDEFIISTSDSKTFKSRVAKMIEDKKIDGVFGVNESATIKTIRTAKNKGYDIGNTLPIAAFCNKSQLRNYPSLIVIEQHAIEIGNKTAQLILNRLKKETINNYTTTTIKASIN